MSVRGWELRTSDSQRSTNDSAPAAQRAAYTFRVMIFEFRPLSS